MEKVVSVQKLKDDLSLEILAGEKYLNKEILLAEIHIPGIEITGYLIENEQEVENKIQILSKEQIKYLYSLAQNVREYNLTHYLNYDFPCIIISEGMELKDDFYNIASITEKPFLRTNMTTHRFIKKLKNYLQKELAPEIVLNNFTLMEIFGMGIMILGDESAKIGTTIELLEKGHRFITDELLVIKKISEGIIIGENGYNQDENDLNYFLSLQNGTKIRVIDYFGIGSTRKSKEIDLIIKFEKWDDKKIYDRLGIEEERQYILGVNVPKIIIPVRKGRNLGIIVETAAINERLKKSGQHSAIYFLEATKQLIKENSKAKSEGKNMGILKHMTVLELKNKFSMNVLNGEEFLEKNKIYSSEVHKPSLEFTGFFDILEEEGKNKIQLIGESELKYMDRMAKDRREKNLRDYFRYSFPCIVLSGIKTIPNYFLNIAVENKILLLSSEGNAAKFNSELGDYLERYFAPSITIHGVLVEVFGFGVLLTGRSGIGKSETALELIHRGHRLIADDMVKFTKYSDGRIVGTAEKIPYFMEIRGLGIIDIKTLYGLGAVRNSKQLDVIIELKELKDDDYLTKASYEHENIDVMEEKINKIDLYISSGRNAASMVEIATMNLRAKKVGYDSNEIYMRNYENIKKISTNNNKEGLFANIGNLIANKKDDK